jgi:hypothetical protein
MTPKMLEAAKELMGAAQKYRQVFSEEIESEPCIFLTDNDTGETVFLADSFNSELVKAHLQLSEPIKK